MSPRRQPGWPAAAAWPGRSRFIPAREVTVGSIVSVRGIRDRASAIVHVLEVDASSELVTIVGRRPWGDGWREVRRECHPQGVVELLIEDEDDDR